MKDSVPPVAAELASPATPEDMLRLVTYLVGNGQPVPAFIAMFARSVLLRMHRGAAGDVTAWATWFGLRCDWQRRWPGTTVVFEGVPRWRVWRADGQWRGWRVTVSADVPAVEESEAASGGT